MLFPMSLLNLHQDEQKARHEYQKTVYFFSRFITEVAAKQIVQSIYYTVFNLTTQFQAQCVSCSVMSDSLQSHGL